MDLHLDLFHAVSVFPSSDLELLILYGKRKTVAARGKLGLKQGKSGTGPGSISQAGYHDCIHGRWEPSHTPRKDPVPILTEGIQGSVDTLSGE